MKQLLGPWNYCVVSDHQLGVAVTGRSSCYVELTQRASRILGESETSVCGSDEDLRFPTLKFSRWVLAEIY